MEQAREWGSVCLALCPSWLNFSLRSLPALTCFYSLITCSLVGDDVGSVGAEALALMLEKNVALEKLW